MASHFVALDRGVQGTKYSDFTTGTSATAHTIELRLDDASTMRAADVEKAILAFRRFFQNPQQWAPAGFVIQP
jgi:hypothetical protein